MIAPYFKQMAEQYKDRAVFAKVDINANYQTASEQMIRSMPTFQLYLFGKKRDQFSGADTNRLSTMLQALMTESQTKNVEITHEALKAFYQDNAPDKLAELDDKKLTDILDKAGKGGGPGHYGLVQALKKKYNGKSPKTRPRAIATKVEGQKTPPPSSKAKAESTKPNLQLATLQELQAEIEKRRDEEEEKRAEAATDDDEATGSFPIYDPKNRTDEIEQIVIIGSGPAGLSAAIYSSRAGLKPVVVAPAMGGQLQGKGVGVENFPGVNESTGPNLVHLMQLQAARFGAVFEQDMVVEVDIRARPFTVKTNETTIRTNSLILSTGADSRWLGVPGEWEHRGGGVSSCATCDGFLFADQDVVVIGGGDTAMEDALVLARTSRSVVVIHRRDKFRASKVLAERVLSHSKIKVRWDSEVVSFQGKKVRVLSNGLQVQLNSDGTLLEEDYTKLRVKEITKRLDQAGVSYSGIKDKEELVKILRSAVATSVAESTADSAEQAVLSSVRVRNAKTKEEEDIACAAAFVAIGHDPNTKFVKDQLEMDSNGYLVTKPGTTRTSVEGVFAAGDVADHVYRQAITSAGTGAMAALDAERWLSEQGFCSKSA
uniref:Thioredoxin reductase n=1 Tax=Cryptomonas curvata TaxID=233186 RepID=A0A7S0MM64_9CRYP